MPLKVYRQYIAKVLPTSLVSWRALITWEIYRDEDGVPSLQITQLCG